MADRFGGDNVERALALQKGSVLANEVLRLREEGERLRAALLQIRDMHQTVDDDPGGPPYCPECAADGYPDPCATSRTARQALGGAS